MNQTNLQQPKKKGLVKILLGMFAMGNVVAGQQAKSLLINGGRAPIPAKILNQRQKRKLKAQTR